MNRLQLLLFIALVSGFQFFAKAQQKNTPPVELIEDKQPKRWLLYAQNNTDEEQEAFLIVQGEGFRRSADRPVIKKLPPNSKVLMITLIPLKGVEPTYTKIFTYENELQDISTRKGADREEFVNIRPLKDDELTVFTEPDCEKCKLLTDFLNKNHYKYRVLDVSTNNKVNDFMFDHLKNSSYKGGIIDLPIVMFEGRKHWSIVDIKTFIREYDWKGLKKS